MDLFQEEKKKPSSRGEDGFRSGVSEPHSIKPSGSPWACTFYELTSLSCLSIPFDWKPLPGSGHALLATKSPMHCLLSKQ